MQIKSLSKVFVWILLGMVIVGLGGFGLNSVGSVQTKIASVGDREIYVTDYVEALQDQSNNLSRSTGMSVDFAMLETFGMHNQVLAELINRKTLDLAAQEMGIGISDETLVSVLQEIPAFQNSKGEFDKSSYFMRLEGADLSAQEFENDLRGDQVRALLLEYLATSQLSQDNIANTLSSFERHERRIKFQRFTPADLETPPDAPTDAEKQAYFDENSDEFLTEEVKKLTVLWLRAEDLAQPEDVERSVIENLYQSNLDSYIQPQKRYVERLVYPTEADAIAALAALQDASKTFDDLIKDRGLSDQDVELGLLAQSELNDEVGPAVFGAELDEVVGPFMTEVGRPALYLVSAVQEAINQTVDDVYDELAQDIAIDRARRALDGRQNEWSDQLFAGATLEELSAEHIYTIDFDTAYDGDLAGYQEFQTLVLSIAEDDFPEITRLEDDSIIAVRLNEVVPPAPKSFAQVETDVENRLTAQALSNALTAHGEALAQNIVSTTPSTGRVVERSVTRGEFYATFPPNFMRAVFEQPLNTPSVSISEEEGYAFVVVSAKAADLSNEENAPTIERQKGQIAGSLQKDLVDALSQALRSDFGYRQDDAALEALHSQLRVVQ